MTDDDLEYLVEDTLGQMSRLDTMTLAELRLVACFCGAPGSEFHDPDRAAEARRLVGIKLAEMSPAERQFDTDRRAALMRVITPLLKSIRLFEEEAGRKAEPDELRDFCRIACHEPALKEASMAKCAFEGCRKTSEAPARDGWAHLQDWRGLKDGWYCRAHADAIEGVEKEGGFGEREGPA